ncbi:hypothetical protein [Weissella confusa]|uniref:hypothetical protein n=1 Tax=Weissella confusa TaxID=1583 RepID=UPI0009FEB77C|nr:hypothetical protein [Weissella confusa]
MFYEQLDPHDDEMPWGEDFEGEEVAQGTEGWDTDEGFVPDRKRKAQGLYGISWASGNSGGLKCCDEMNITQHLN